VLGLTSTIGYGTIYYSFSLMSLEFIKHFNWTQTFVYGAFSASILLSALLSPVFDRLLNRYSARLPIILVCF